jgi:hypothetical protein
LESLLTARFALVGWAFLVAALGPEQALICLLHATLRQFQENQPQPRPVVVVVVQTLVGLIHAWADQGSTLHAVAGPRSCLLRHVSTGNCCTHCSTQLPSAAHNCSPNTIVICYWAANSKPAYLTAGLGYPACVSKSPQRWPVQLCTLQHTRPLACTDVHDSTMPWPCNKMHTIQPCALYSSLHSVPSA